MTTPAGILFQNPVVKPLSSNGTFMAGCTATFYLTGSTTLTNVYADGALTTPLANPLSADASGTFVPVYLDPGVIYRVQIKTSTGALISDTDPYVPIGVNSSAIGKALYPQLAVETNAGVTAVNFQYPAGYVDRYATNTTPGTTDMTTAIKNALLVNAAGGPPVTFLAGTYLVTDTCIKILVGQPKITVRGVPFATIIVNKAGASKPTIQLLGAAYFDIRGLVIIGASGFPNIGIELLKDGSANRCAFGYIADIACCTNGGGIHVQDTNTIHIENYQYWPSGQNWGAVVTDPNPQPYGFLADGTGAVNGVTLRTINVGNLNSIANNGCGIKIDGSASAAPFQAWELDEYESEIVGTRALWLRNVNIGTFKNLFVENAEVRIDQGCVRLAVEEVEGAATATIVVDGTQTLGASRQLSFITCQAKSFTADAANLETFHVGCSYSGAGGFADSSLNARWINVETTGSVLLPDQLNAWYRFKAAALTRAVTALADDSDLIVTGLPKGTYLFRGYLQIQGITTGTQGFQFALRLGGGQAGTNWIVPSGIINTAFSSPNNVANAATPIGYGTITTAANTDELTFEGIVSTNGTGDIAVQWAENTASANGTKLNAGSWFKVEKIA